MIFCKKRKLSSFMRKLNKEFYGVIYTPSAKQEITTRIREFLFKLYNSNGEMSLYLDIKINNHVILDITVYRYVWFAKSEGKFNETYYLEYQI
jgi:hypothetical protein